MVYAASFRNDLRLSLAEIFICSLVFFFASSVDAPTIIRFSKAANLFEILT